MPAFDTSVLVPLLDRGHPRHTEAARRFDAADQVLIHPAVASELTTVVRRLAKDRGQDGNRAARQALRALLEQPRVRLESELQADAALRRYLADAALSFTDALVAQMRWHHDQQEPVAFDDDLLRASRIPVADLPGASNVHD
jgi:predicted nucleic acid-binding protein